VVSDQVDRCTHDWPASCTFQADRLTDDGCDDLIHLAPQIVGRVGRGAEHDYTSPGTGDQKKADFNATFGEHLFRIAGDLIEFGYCSAAVDRLITLGLVVV
jgi:hypothetical protein